MDLGDILLGWLIKEVFTKDRGGGGGGTTSPGTIPQGGQPSTPSATPEAAPALPAAPGPQPSFPQNVPVPPAPEPGPQPQPGFLRAVEVWQVRPDLVAAAPASVVGNARIGAITLEQAQQSFPVGWQAAKVVTSQEAAIAKSLLKQWSDGGVVFMGPGTLAGRRAYRMTKHPLHTPQGSPSAPAPQPTPHAAPSAPAPQAAPQASPSAPAPQAAPSSPAAPSADVEFVTAVRRGEGLAQVAKRLGFPATAQSAAAIRAANIPTGPDADWSATKDGNLKKKGRAGGLQPGDHLFVPAQWTPQIDPARL